MNYTYRKKPVEIEAFRMTAERGMDNQDWPTWLHQAWELGDSKGGKGGLWIARGMPDRSFLIGTDEGTLKLAWGDWIIRGVKGEIYPCRNDIFEMTYDEVA